MGGVFRPGSGVHEGHGAGPSESEGRAEVVGAGVVGIGGGGPANGVGVGVDHGHVGGEDPVNREAFVANERQVRAADAGGHDQFVRKGGDLGGEVVGGGGGGAVESEHCRSP